MKRHSWFVNSPKKRTKMFCPSRLGQNWSFHVRFLWKLETPKWCVEITWPLALEATELVSEPITQMAVELINCHLISVQCSKRDECKSYILFHVTIKFWNDGEMMLRSYWTSHLQMMNNNLWLHAYHLSKISILKLNW